LLLVLESEWGRRCGDGEAARLHSIVIEHYAFYLYAHRLNYFHTTQSIT
jgi:hypothetical protein